ncbi:hypothetical protein SUGI_0241070 [Cryptomeria japonica]|uniref:uncharacterized protein LOC131029616 n=1 Tax=Cryptomeria japonica TaxID=3369 RepID=UPI002408EFAC|nr:uncharacterized protein LOC131029616 [Cryptomeria japonica]GLJ14823.1 hypothetical protein SUGI_0241070 [Cryptomeria japonica]
MKGNGITKRSQRGRRNFLKALRNYLMSDSYMYGALINPNNYSASSDATALTRTQGTFWQAKKTSVTLSSAKFHTSLKPLASHSNETDIPITHDNHDANCQDVPIEKTEKVKHVIEHSASPSTIDHTNQTGKPTAVTKRHLENVKRTSRKKSS